MATQGDWANLESKFDQLRKESAISEHPMSGSSPKALWYRGPGPDGEWSFEYWGEDDGLGVTDRYKWLACEAAALLGFSDADDTTAIPHWLSEQERHAPKA